MSKTKDDYDKAYMISVIQKTQESGADLNNPRDPIDELIADAIDRECNIDFLHDRLSYYIAQIEAAAKAVSKIIDDQELT